MDTKSKAAKLRNYQRGTGGGGPFSAPLHEIEEKLITLMGMESVTNHSNIIDPAEVSNTKFYCLFLNYENIYDLHIIFL